MCYTIKYAENDDITISLDAVANTYEAVIWDKKQHKVIRRSTHFQYIFVEPVFHQWCDKHGLTEIKTPKHGRI